MLKDLKRNQTWKPTATIAAIAIILSCMNFQPSYAQSKELADSPKFERYLEEDPARAAGFYHQYEVPTASDSKVPKRPKGYEAFYISHYGRHGCRWHTSEMKYKGTLEILENAHNKGLLTQIGERFLSDMKIVADDAQDRYGDLSPKGARTHKGIADRMYGNYPEVFKPGAKIDSKSTIIVRCVLSMAAFNEGLKEHEPRLEISRQASQKYMCYMANHVKSPYGKEMSSVSDSLRKEYIPTERFMKSLFKDSGAFLKGQIRDEQSLLYDCFEMAAMMQNIDYLNKDLYYIFDHEEIIGLWKYMNAWAYMNMGPAERYGDVHICAAKPLLENILQSADDVISGKNDIAATLRFGHDSNIIPLYALMGIEGASARVPVRDAADNWNLSFVSPMATNIQFIFFRPKKSKEKQLQPSDIRVRVLMNERDAALPIKGAPFYNWTDLKTYLVNRLKSE